MTHNPTAATANIEQPAAPNFDLVARPYRWLEYLSFGRALWRCRAHFLPQLGECRNALVLGDGDGRFTAALLRANPHIRVDAIDSSATMLHLLIQRAQSSVPDASTRLRPHHTDARIFVRSLAPNAAYDLIVTHFFLDCFTQRDVESLAHDLTPHLQPGALWLVSDFRIPSGISRWPAEALVGSLYLAFRILTGLGITHLPDHAAALGGAGFTRMTQKLSLVGILTAELWIAHASTSEPA